MDATWKRISGSTPDLPLQDRVPHSIAYSADHSGRSTHRGCSLAAICIVEEMGVVWRRFGSEEAQGHDYEPNAAALADKSTTRLMLRSNRHSFAIASDSFGVRFPH